MLYYTEVCLSEMEVPDERSICIYISGCPHHCKNCHYPELQNSEYGDVLADNYETIVMRYKKQATCVCLMGEGRCQYDDIAEIVYYSQYAHELGLKFCLYSGRDTSVGRMSWAKGFDYIKTGKYIEELGPLDSITTNQRMYKVVGGEYIDITEKLWKNKEEQQRELWSIPVPEEINKLEYSGHAFFSGTERYYIDKIEDDYWFTCIDVPMNIEKIITGKLTSEEMRNIRGYILECISSHKWERRRYEDGDILDGLSWKFSIKDADGISFSCNGYAMLPEGFNEMLDKLDNLSKREELTQEKLPDKYICRLLTRREISMFEMTFQTEAKINMLSGVQFFKNIAGHTENGKYIVKTDISAEEAQRYVDLDNASLEIENKHLIANFNELKTIIKEKRKYAVGNVNDTIKVKYIGPDNRRIFDKSKIYTARILVKGWYGIVDESGEEYAFRPEYFEIVEDKQDKNQFLKPISGYAAAYLKKYGIGSLPSRWDTFRYRDESLFRECIEKDITWEELLHFQKGDKHMKL